MNTVKNKIIINAEKEKQKRKKIKKNWGFCVSNIYSKEI